MRVQLQSAEGPESHWPSLLAPALIIALIATLLVALPYLSPVALLLMVEFAVLLGAFCFYDPLLYLMIFFLPLAPLVQVGDFPVHDLASLTRVVMFAGVMARKTLEPEPLWSWLGSGLAQKLTLAYCGIAVVSAAVANPIEAGAGRALFRLASYVAVFFIVTAWVRSGEQLKRITGILFASTIVACLVGFWQAANGDFGDWWRALYVDQEPVWAPWVGRINSVFLNTNPFAGYLNLLLPLFLAVEYSPSFTARFRVAARISFFIGTVALVLVQSRGAFLGFALMVFLFVRYFIKAKADRKRFFLDLSCAVAIGSVISWMATQAALSGEAERLTSIDESTLIRLLIYSSAWKMFLSAPVLGIGYGNFRSHLTPLMGGNVSDVWDTHSLYLKLLSETGIAGFLCFMALVVVLIRRARDSWKANATGVEAVFAAGFLGAITTVLAHGLVEVNNEVPQFGAMLWLTFGLYLAATRLGGARKSPDQTT
ncbi:MAG TPA: O-antigen ligase family protein [Alphaproteobacteria bacterium]|nr:O-antigen ligase family protein [Alphaproteobacteria bacterium]